MTIKEKIKRVVEHLLHYHRVTVDFTTQPINEYDEYDKIISVYSRVKDHVKLNSILHEAGHALFREKEIRAKRNLKYSKRYIACAEVLREEVLAWEEGRELANFLALNLDQKAYDHDMKKSLNSYINFYVKRRKRKK